MTPEYWHRVKQIFSDALEREPAERGAFLDQVCGDDRVLREQVDGMLAHHAMAADDSFMKTDQAQPWAELSDRSVTEVDEASTIGPHSAAQETSRTDQQAAGTPRDQSPAPLGKPSGLERIGDYELLEEIGRGGMGVVYKARQLQPHRIVALKTILTGAFARSAEIERFQREAEAAAALDHPGIIPIYEVGRDNNRHYYSMAYVDGPNLQQYLRQHGPLQPREAARLVWQVAEAVHYAHRRGVIHRDLKPANVLLKRSHSSAIQQQGDASTVSYHPFSALDAQPVIADFGLAKQADAEAGLTLTGQIMGTPNYMSPEQAAGKTGQVGPASDIYSLGAILYFLLTGEPPFTADTSQELLQQVIHDEPVRPSRLEPKLSRDLEAICLKCLEKQPQRRYATTGELAEDLARWQRGEAVRAQRLTVGYRLAKYLRRNRRTVAAIGVAALCGCLILAIWGVHSIRSRQALHTAVIDLQREAYEHIEAHRAVQAMLALNKTEALLKNTPGLAELKREVARQIDALREPVAARERLAEFRRLYEQTLVTSSTSGATSLEDARRLVAMCEEALSVYRVLEDETRREAQLGRFLSDAEQQRLEKDLDTLLAVYFDAQHEPRLRGAKMTGLGFTMQRVDDDRNYLPCVTNVEAGSPAAAANLHVDDKVITIDGVDVAAFKDLDEVIGQLRGPPGSSVKLQVVLAHGTPAVREVEIRRGEQGLGLWVERVRQLSVAAPLENRAFAQGVAEGDLLLYLDGQAVEGPSQEEEGKAVTLPFISCFTLLRERRGPALNLLLLDARTRQPKQAILPWDQQRAANCERLHLQYLLHNMRVIRGGIELALATRDETLLKGVYVEDPDAGMEDHLEHYYADAYPWPRDLVRQAIAMSSDKLRHFQIGLRLQAEGSYADAVQQYQRELQSQSNHADSFRMIGVCQSSLENWEQAITAWTAYLAMRPDSAQGYLWRGKAFLNSGQSDLAERDLNTCVQLNPVESIAEDARQILRRLESADVNSPSA